MMIDLALRFKDPLVVFIFLLTAAAGWVWAYLRFRRQLPVTLTPVIVVNLLLLAVWGCISGIEHDEAVHLHLSWLVSRGEVVFRDFWMHHSPFLWLILAPLVKACLSPAAFVIARIISALVFTLNVFLGWKIAKMVWGRQARFSVYILVLISGAITAEYLFIRPDIFMVFFLLAGIYFSLRILHAGMLYPFLAGVSLGLAASFVFKQYLLYLVPVVAVFAQRRRGNILRLVMYGVGFLAGLLPLAQYLMARQIVKEYIFWLVRFNSKVVVFSIFFPVVMALLGGWGAWLLLKRARRSGDHLALVLLSVFVLSTMSSLTSVASLNGKYYLSFWFFACALAASGCPVIVALERVRSAALRACAAGVFVSLLVAPNMVYTLKHHKTFLSEDLKVMAELMRYSSGQGCVAMMPYHPLWAYDTARFYSFWQYFFSEGHDRVRDDLRRAGIADALTASPPAVIQCSLEKKDIFLRFFLLGWISKDDYRRIHDLLEQSYTVKDIAGQKYYIRNDRL